MIFSKFLKTAPLLGWMCCALAAWAHAGDVQSLAGKWRFEMDPADVGEKSQWFSHTLSGEIHLPGILEAQGYGDAIGIHTPWVLTLYDHYWYLRSAYEGDTNTGRVRIPFLSQPPRHYAGAAWFQRDFDVPVGWKGQRITLFLERPHWKTTLWVDHHRVGSDISLCTPHEYDLGSLEPGRHEMTLLVDNRMILPYRPDAHSISDSLDDSWNGVVGKIELRATPRIWLERVRVFPDVTNRSAVVQVTIGNATGESGSGWLSVVRGNLASSRESSDAVPVSWQANGAETQCIIPPDPHAGLWDEFHPALETWTLLLTSREGTDARTVRFGFRSLTTSGTQFYLNGHPAFFRGTHFGGDFPLTGYPPTEVESWRKLFETCKDYGLNHMRFHSWCPPEAAFTAADEIGFYLQVEPGMWNAFAPGSAVTLQLYSETERILQDFGNHPSLMLISASNEASGRWKQVLPEWVRHFRKEDSRHLYTPDTGWSLVDDPHEPVRSDADYLDVGRVGGWHVRGEGGWFGGDYERAIQGLDVPVISHEVGQWCAYPNLDMIRDFHGFMQPGNFEIIRDSARAHGVLPMNHAFAAASASFQLACYKEEVEAALRTPGLGGFQLLDLHDYTGQGTALVGLLDPFWKPKGRLTPEIFRSFCSDLVPLARLKRRIFTTQDTLVAGLEAANFSAAPLARVRVQWFIADKNGRPCISGPLTEQACPLGKGIPLGTVHAELASLPVPGQYQLQVSLVPVDDAGKALEGQARTNQWNLWVYPPVGANDMRSKTEVVVTRFWDDAAKQLALGHKVLLLPQPSTLSWWSPPLGRVPVFWNALMGPSWSRMLGLYCDLHSAALSGFPTSDFCDWQWISVIRQSRAIDMDRMPKELRPIVWAIDDWNRNEKLAVIFEAKVLKGSLLVCTADLDSGPAGAQLRRSLLAYMNSPGFAPHVSVSSQNMSDLFFDNLSMERLGATILADGQAAPELMDGDPNTFWSSADARGRGRAHPHVFTISFPKTVPTHGLLLMPRQNQREHLGDIRQYLLEGSQDDIHWQVVAHGELASSYDPQTIEWKRGMRARYLRLTALSGFGPDTSSALAELAVLPDDPLPTEETGQVQYHDVPTASPDIDAGGGNPLEKNRKP